MEKATRVVMFWLITLTIFQLSPQIVSAADRTLTCSASDTIQAFLPRLRAGDRLLVSGTCNENLSISDRFNSITLDGQGTATINGTDTTANTIVIRGRNITIKGFQSITGGSRGILVNRGGSAIIDGNTIHNTGSDGIQVSENGTARIINNTIQNNPEDGIRLSENGSAHIGFSAGSDATTSPNTIQNNSRGIGVFRSSSARIVGNVIQNSTGNDGIQVFRASFADIANNTISGNAGDGISLGENSAVQLGEDSGLFALGNTGTNNTGFGINCVQGGSVDGLQSTITGTLGATSIAASCINSLSP